MTSRQRAPFVLAFVLVGTTHAFAQHPPDLPAPRPEAPQPEQPPEQAPPAQPPFHDPSSDPGADRPMLKPAHKPREIVIEIPGERSKQNKILLGATLGAGVIAGAVGLYFHLDSRSAANEVEAVKFEGQAWTQDEVDLVDRAASSRKGAAVGYAIGGAFVVGTIAAFIATAPKSERTVIRTGASSSLDPSLVPTVVPVVGPHGAMALGTWSF